MTQKFKTEKWFTSPWNFDENVTKQFNFAKNIKLHDVTLRDGEQQAGLIFNKDQKVAMAEKMAEVGIHRIEAGMPAVSAQDEAAIKEIVKRNLGPEIFAFARCVKDDVRRAADCGVKGIVIEIPSSDHMIEKAYQWSLDKAIKLSIEATQLAKELGLYTVFFPIDMTRADMNWVLNLVEKVATEGHMDALAIVDTFGGLAPSAVPNLVKTVKARIDKPVEVHFHDDFGMGAANTALALAAGADVAHTTIMGIGERAGNASYEEIALTLLTMYGVDLGLNYNKIYDLSKYLREVSNLPTRPNQGIFGDNIFDIESGIVAGWYDNVKESYPLELSPYLPELTGHKNSPNLVLGKHSGMPSVNDWLKKLGLTATEEQKTAILAAVKARAYEKAGLLNEEDFVNVVNNIIK